VSRLSVIAVILLVALGAAGCGSAGNSHAPSTSPTTTAARTTTATSPNALQAEAASAAAGDIPDNQIFLFFHDGRAGYSMKYPEGWAQRGSAGSVTFNDKNNIVRVVVTSGPAWTRASVTADGRNLKGARLQGLVHAISLSGRPAFKVVYRTVSPPSPVTGKRVTLTVDRYYLSSHGRRVVLDLGCPVGVDNVDAYRLMSESFRWN
jgi:hypothetical protein